MLREPPQILHVRRGNFQFLTPGDHVDRRVSNRRQVRPAALQHLQQDPGLLKDLQQHRAGAAGHRPEVAENRERRTLLGPGPD